MINHLPAIQKPQVWSLDQEDALEKGMVTHSNILAWRIPLERGAWWAIYNWATDSLSMESLFLPVLWDSWTCCQRILALCAEIPNRNIETELWRRRKELLYFFAKQEREYIRVYSSFHCEYFLVYPVCRNRSTNFGISFKGSCSMYSCSFAVSKWKRDVRSLICHHLIHFHVQLFIYQSSLNKVIFY